MTWRELLLEFIDLSPEIKCQNCGEIIQPEISGKNLTLHLRCPDCRDIICRITPIIIKMIKEKIRAERRRQFEENLKNR